VALKPVWTVRFFSGVLMFAGITTFLYNILATVVGRNDAPAANPAPGAAA
jgi:cbb3-type cytochrome oxidase subunit 1